LWNFDSNGLSGWGLSAEAGASGSLGTAASPGRSGFSLQVASASFSGGTSLSLHVTLCSGFTVQFPAGSFTFKVDVRFESSSGLPFGDDGTGGGAVGILAETDQGSFLINDQNPVPLGTWRTLSRTLPLTSATNVNLRFDPLSPWNGTIYIDNISVQ
jgi:hypothetical protein